MQHRRNSCERDVEGDKGPLHVITGIRSLLLTELQRWVDGFYGVKTTNYEEVWLWLGGN